MPADLELLESLLRVRALPQNRIKQQRALGDVSLRPTPPISAERTYERALTKLVQQSQREILKAITPLLPLIATERADALLPDFEQVLEGLRILFAQISQTASPEDIARAQAGRVDRHVRKQLARLIRISPEFAELRTGGDIESFIIQNTLLIQDLLFSQLGRVRATLEDASRSGLTVSQIADQLESTLKVSRNRALLIARDQTLKLNGQLQQARQENLGVREYIWDTSQDERVRPEHRRLHGTRQQWLTPPVTDRRGSRNHPGGDILCRCVAIPVVRI